MVVLRSLVVPGHTYLNFNIKYPALTRYTTQITLLLLHTESFVLHTPELCYLGCRSRSTSLGISPRGTGGIQAFLNKSIIDRENSIGKRKFQINGIIIDIIKTLSYDGFSPLHARTSGLAAWLDLAWLGLAMCNHQGIAPSSCPCRELID